MYKISCVHASKVVSSLALAMRYANRLHEVGRPVTVIDLASGEVVIAYGQVVRWRVS